MKSKFSTVILFIGTCCFLYVLCISIITSHRLHEKPANTEAVLEQAKQTSVRLDSDVLKEYDVPLTSELSEDLMAQVPTDGWLEHIPYGCRVEYKGVGVDKSYTLTQGPIGTPYFQNLTLPATINLQCRICDEQPEGLQIVNPHLHLIIHKDWKKYVAKNHS